MSGSVNVCVVWCVENSGNNCICQHHFTNTHTESWCSLIAPLLTSSGLISVCLVSAANVQLWLSPSVH